MGYIDPSAFGIVSQIGYLALFAVVTAFMFFFNPLKNLAKHILGRSRADTDPQESDDSVQSGQHAK